MALTIREVPVLTIIDGKLVPQDQRHQEILRRVLDPEPVLELETSSDDEDSGDDLPLRRPRAAPMIDDSDEEELPPRAAPMIDYSDDEEPLEPEDGSDEEIDLPLEVDKLEINPEQLPCDDEEQFWAIIVLSGFDPLTGKVQNKIGFDRMKFAQIYGEVANRLRNVIDGLIPPADMERVLSHYVWQGPDFFRGACEDSTFVVIDHTDGMCFGYRW